LPDPVRVTLELLVLACFVWLGIFCDRHACSSGEQKRGTP
jgi:hypothetical protein